MAAGQCRLSISARTLDGGFAGVVIGLLAGNYQNGYRRILCRLLFHPLLRDLPVAVQNRFVIVGLQVMSVLQKNSLSPMQQQSGGCASVQRILSQQQCAAPQN